MIDEALELGEDAMKAARERFGREIGKVRAGRASPTLLDGIKVEAYGVQMQLREVASISTADARLLVVKPFDANNIPAVERAIIQANIGLNPSSDGVVLRLPIPPLTEERRKQLVKQVGDLAEEAKIAIRQARREANDLLKESEKSKDISEDDLKRGLEQIQELTNDYTKQIDDGVKKKEAEILDD